MTGSKPTTSRLRLKLSAADAVRCALVTAASAPVAWLAAALLSHRTVAGHERIATVVFTVLLLGNAVRYSVRSWVWSGVFLAGLLMFPAVLDRRCLLLGSVAIPMLTAVAMYCGLTRDRAFKARLFRGDKRLAHLSPPMKRHYVLVAVVDLGTGVAAVLGAAVMLTPWPGSVDRLLANAWKVQWSMWGEERRLVQTRGDWERVISVADVKELEGLVKREFEAVKATEREARKKEREDYLQEASLLYRRAAEQLRQTQDLAAAVRLWESISAASNRKLMEHYEKAALAQADALAARAAASRAADRIEPAAHEFGQAAELIKVNLCIAVWKAEQVAGARKAWETALHAVDSKRLAQYASEEFAQAQRMALEAALKDAAGDAVNSAPLYNEAGKTLQHARLSALLAEAKANDSREKAKAALAALDELLKLDPNHAEAIKLRRKVLWYDLTLDLGGGVKMTFVLIPDGEFVMGSPPGEPGRSEDETQHKVKLTRPFFMLTTPVTQAQWQAVMGNNPSHFHGDDLPVEQVSWNDAVAFCQRLSQKEGKRCRLPTEAEWEYACRAGSQTPYGGSGNLDEMGWYGSNSNHRTHPVAGKKPNVWNLYDMHGNLWQWCSDGYGPYAGDAVDPTGSNDGSSRVLRGGSWYTEPAFCRAAYRNRHAPENRLNHIGFRLCLDF